MFAPLRSLLAFLGLLLTTALLAIGVPSVAVATTTSPAIGRAAYSYDVEPLHSATSTHVTHVGAAHLGDALTSWRSPLSVRACGVAAKYGDDAIEGIGDARSYVNLTEGGSIRNVGTNVTHTEFAETLTSGGWISRPSKDGAVQIFQRDGAKYVLRSKNSSGYPGWTADFTPAGSTRHTLEIRLGYAP